MPAEAALVPESIFSVLHVCFVLLFFFLALAGDLALGMSRDSQLLSEIFSVG